MRYDGSNTSWLMAYLEMDKNNNRRLHQMAISNESKWTRHHKICKCPKCKAKHEYDIANRGYWFYPSYINHSAIKECPKCKGTRHRRLDHD